MKIFIYYIHIFRFKSSFVSLCDTQFEPKLYFFLLRAQPKFIDQLLFHSIFLQFTNFMKNTKRKTNETEMLQSNQQLYEFYQRKFTVLIKSSYHLLLPSIVSGNAWDTIVYVCLHITMYSCTCTKREMYTHNYISISFARRRWQHHNYYCQQHCQMSILITNNSIVIWICIGKQYI